MNTFPSTPTGAAGREPGTEVLTCHQRMPPKGAASQQGRQSPPLRRRAGWQAQLASASDNKVMERGNHSVKVENEHANGGSHPPRR